MNEKELAAFAEEMRRLGIAPDEFDPYADGVLFKTEGVARIFAERHDKDVVQIEGGRWLAKNRTPKN